MRCHTCGAPRRADMVSCAYCSTAFTQADSPPRGVSIGPKAFDAEFVRMRRQPRTEALLHERSRLPAAPRTSPLVALAPLLILGAVAGYIVYSRRSADGSLDRENLVIAGAFVAMGVAAAITALRRSARQARTPIEGHLVRVGLRGPARVEPRKGDEYNPLTGLGKARWVLAFEDGTERFVWPVEGMRGKAELARGAVGVAWLQGARLLGFEPV